MERTLEKLLWREKHDEGVTLIIEKYSRLEYFMKEKYRTEYK